MSDSPYTLFWNWCFDNKPNSPIPNPEVLLKYNSPINSTFLLKSFIRHAKLNHYLNTYLNNIGIYYIDQEELFYFTKQCIKDFKVKRKEIHYSPYQAKNALFEKLRKKLPCLKSYDIDMLAGIIQKSPDRDSVYGALGLEKPKKQKLKKQVQQKKISLRSFLQTNFNRIKVKVSDYKI